MAGQTPKEDYNLKQMLEILTAQGVEVKLCKICTDVRGMNELALVDGVANDE
ncbi:DsrE family protein [Xenorhabdus sp. BG5]|nr:DsrE family protein [Xenorhabdus sp. BG5]